MQRNSDRQYKSILNAAITRAFTVKSKSRMRLLSVNGQAPEETPILEIKDMLPSTYSTSISGVDDETGVVLFESNSSLEVKPQPTGTVAPASGSALRVQSGNATPNTSLVELERASTAVQVRVAIPSDATDLNFTASVADSSKDLRLEVG